MPPKRKFSGSTFARHDVFNKGVIWGMHLAKASREDIMKQVTKTDGSTPSKSTIDEVIAHKKANPEWNGVVDTHNVGRPPALTVKQKEKLVDLVFAERGSTKVTIAYCKKKLPFLRSVSMQTVSNALHDAGLKFLQRRQKKFIPSKYSDERVAYAQSVLARHQSTLSRYAYTDGTTFYLARDSEEGEGKKRRILGSHVWRMSSGKDGLWDDNVGPSLYAKAQGLPVKIWGFFANGWLEYYLLPKQITEGGKTSTCHMNGGVYNQLVTQRFAIWRRACLGDAKPVHLVQDHEKCLWQERNLTALRHVGCRVVADFPRSSPDLNAIEGWWQVLRVRLEETEPEGLETREDFVTRLRRTVHWLNDNRAQDALSLASNQKARAKNVLELEGARTKW